MIFYRGKGHTEREAELKTIIEQAEKSGSKKTLNIRRSFQVIMSPAFLRPFRCVGVLWILFQSSVIPVLSTYAHTFLEVQK